MIYADDQKKFYCGLIKDTVSTDFLKVHEGLWALRWPFVGPWFSGSLTDRSQAHWKAMDR